MGQIAKGQKAPNFIFNTPWEQGLDFYTQLGKKNVLIFSRYIGCSACQLELIDLVKDYSKFLDNGAEVFVILQSSPRTTQRRLKELGVQFTVILDIEEKIYKLYGVKAAESAEELAPASFIPHLKELAVQYSLEHGEYEGNELQLPAAFIINQSGNVEFARYGTHAIDYPTTEELLQFLS